MHSLPTIASLHSAFHPKVLAAGTGADLQFLLQIREKEANVDNLINPIEDMYSLLMRYEVRVPKEETDMVGDLRYSWKKLRKLSTDVSDNLARLQVINLLHENAQLSSLPRLSSK